MLHRPDGAEILWIVPDDADRREAIDESAKDESPGCGLHGAAGLKDLDGEGLEEEGEARVLSRPRRLDRFRPMLRATATGKTGDQFRRELRRVQVPPSPLIGVIGQAAVPAAFGAHRAGTDVEKADLDSSIPELEVDRLPRQESSRPSKRA